MASSNSSPVPNTRYTGSDGSKPSTDAVDRGQIDSRQRVAIDDEERVVVEFAAGAGGAAQRIAAIDAEVGRRRCERDGSQAVPVKQVVNYAFDGKVALELAAARRRVASPPADDG